MEKCIKLIKNSKNILIFTGAGISTNSGIPDFRSHNGLYSFAKEKYNIPYPEAIFDINYFNKNPRPFFKLSRDLLKDDVQPTITHQFIKKLEDIGKLEIVATQNIDMLHEKCGNKKVLACHGSYQEATCCSCSKKYKFNDIKKDLLNGDIPYCSCKGVIKPNITFYGESLPEEFFNFISNPPKIDLVIVIGTSLEVAPANQIPLIYSGKTPLIIINRDKTAYDRYFDYCYLMDCDDFSRQLLKEL